uniref:Uncharacterized protein n=1 Tax=Anguilla anguilla TaxID=7936 RepID=A0A0E9SYV8_ANGAN
MYNIVSKQFFKVSSIFIPVPHYFPKFFTSACYLSALNPISVHTDPAPFFCTVITRGEGPGHLN